MAARAPAGAQTVFDQNGFGTGRGTYAALPYEHVDPLSGNLIVVTTDLVLPGNAGLDIVVQRVYNSAVYPNYENAGDKTLEEDSWAGIGWRLHFGRVLYEEDNGSGKTKIEMGDGSQHALYTTPARSEGWITKSFWVYDKNNHTLKLPNGHVYTFGHRVFIANLGYVRYVTEIRDAFNNALEFSYFAAGGPPDGVAQIRQDLGQSQVRLVTFTYNAALNSLATMQYGDSIWTYTQTAFGPPGHSALTSVQPPAGAKPWTYTYESAPGFVALATMQAPSGGIASYTYGDSTRSAGPTAPYFTQRSRVVTTRSIGGPSNVGITPGTWTFTYNQGPNQDQSIVDCPCGKTVYRYAGIGTDPSGNYAAWSTGLLVERKMLGPSNQVLEREALTWAASPAVSPDAVPGQSGIWSDPDVYNALLTNRLLERDSLSWTTVNTYNMSSSPYADYGQPYEVTESGGGRTRTTSRTFRHNFTPYIVGELASATTTVGSETSTASWTYDTATGDVTSETRNGVTTSLTSWGNGNPRFVDDAHGHRTTLARYDWGVVSEIQTPLVTTYRVVSPTGLITRDEIGTSQTNYTYDLAFRLTRASPPNANPIIYTYDGLWDGWTRVERGSSQTHTVVDGFGRPVSSVNEVQQKTFLRRDACGRVVFQALPYQNAILKERGIETTYDGLGRVTKSKFVGGGSVTSETNYSYSGINVTITDPIGRVTTQEYAGIGGPGDAVLTAVVDQANQRTTYTYDIGNRLKQVGGAMPARSWSYNARGLVQQETQPESGTTSYTYDGAGLLKTITDALGQVFTLSYDANERLVSHDGPGTASDLTQTYDALGRLSTLQNADVTTTYQYDNAGRLSLRRDVFQSRTYESLYGYDGNDSLTSLTYPSGRVVGYGYDAEGRLTSVTQNGMAFAGSFVYDDGGGLAEYRTGAVTHRTEYDILQRVSRMTAGPGAPSFDLTYAYNDGSQITSITDPRYGESTYQYDALNRMKQAQGPWGNYSWTYDAAGNRLTEHMGGPTTFTYDTAKQRLTAFLTETGGEAFTYDAVGRLASDGRGAYTYTPSGMLASVTNTNLSASYTYDAASARVLRTVNGIGYYTIRGAGGQVLSEYEARCGAPAWTRDVVYGGSRAIGSIKAPLDLPTIALTTTSSSISEAGGTVSATVRLTTPTGTAMTCAASVSYGVVTHAGEAARGADFGGAAATLVFPAGTASGATQAITVNVRQDTIYETSERFTIDLNGATGAKLGTASHIVTITNDDPPPSITINDPAVTEGPGAQAIFTLTLSPASAVQAEVNYTTAPETAGANVDYATTAGRVIFLPGETQKQVAVSVIDDAHAELAETFVLQLSGPAHATLTRSYGRATIADNDGPRVPIDPTLPGTYLPDITTAADTAAYVPIFNPHNVAVTARLTFTRPNGAGAVRDVVVPAQTRITVDLATEPVVGGQGDASLVVQSLDVARPIVAEASTYWQTDWRGGRNARGTITLSPIYFFGEGATNTFEEFLVVHNPSNEPINVLVKLFATGGGLQQFVVPIASGPGRVKIRVNDYAPSLEHGSSVAGLTLAGAPINIAVERTMYWLGGDRRDGHSTNGINGVGGTYYFAEGSTGAFSTFLAFANPNATASNVLVHYLHENGTDYQQTVSIPPYGRTTVSPPGSVPTGAFAIHTETTNAVFYAAERVVYGGANWTLGDAETGNQFAQTGWRFAEGAANSFFSSFLLLMNPNTTAATVALTFRLESGGTVTSSATVPPRGRVTISLNGIPGLTGTFATEVAVTNGVPIAAERAMYWPASSWDGAHISRGKPW